MLTSSWFTALPDDHQMIGISRGSPRRQKAGYRRYAALAPGTWFQSVDTEEYVQRYLTEILAPLDPHKVWNDLHRLAGPKVPVLVCYEQINTGSWCHRGIVAAWFASTLCVEVAEFGHVELGTGKTHPMLPYIHGLTLGGHK